MSFGSLDRQKVRGLQVSFLEEEVFSALSDFNRDRALGLMVFYNFLPHWNFVKDVVMVFLGSFMGEEVLKKVRISIFWF